MALPYKIATLLYVFDASDRILLMKRAQEPNLGLWSPCGGKLKTELGESPYTCVCREAQEELNWTIQPEELHLTGLVSEHGYQGHAHWLMFLFEVKTRITSLPPPHREGTFQFFTPRELDPLPMPQTDREQIWPLFWKHRGGFFAAHCRCQEQGGHLWKTEESLPRV